MYLLLIHLPPIETDLNNKTFQGKNGKKLAAELRAAQKHAFPILMLHENDPACGGCEFAIFCEYVHTRGHHVHVMHMHTLHAHMNV